MSNKLMLEKAAIKFIDKVESGRARSVETYKELKEALAASEADNRSERQVDAMVSNQFEDFIIIGTFAKLEIDLPLEIKTIVRRVKEKDHIAAMELFAENTKDIYPGYKKLPLTVLRTYQLIEC